MRSLRTGQGLHSDADTGGPTQPPSGVAKSEEGFLLGLTEAIGSATGGGQAILVFRFHSRLLGLQQWSDFMPVADDDMATAIDELVLSLDPNLVILRTARQEILGYGSQPMSVAAAERLGGRLVAGLTTSLGPPGQEFVISPRLGVAVINNNQSPEEAVEAATRTLIQTNFDMPFLVHSDFVRDRSLRQELVRNDLPGALSGREISVEFQPRVSSEGFEPVGLEVFPRWHHPTRGTVPTLDFLQVAERSGLLVDLGRTVRETAAEVADEWLAADLLGDRRIWLNISPVELCHRDFLASLAALSEGHPGLTFGFEVSDSRVLEDPVFFRIFDKLQEVGAALALDNVRSSSLSIGRLRRLPLAMLNLDGELVRGLPSRSADRNLVRLLCSHAAGQQVKVCACEVETSEQLEVAASLGVDAVQGKFISPPMPPERMIDHLESGIELPSTRSASLFSR